MYNRYIPQSDGSYRRSSIPEPAAPRRPQEAPKAPTPPPPPPPECPPPAPSHPPRSRCTGCRSPRPKPKAAPSQSYGIGSFLKKLLPGDFDTGDLLVVILLLLMSADECEDQSTALLTLALYLFL